LLGILFYSGSLNRDGLHLAFGSLSFDGLLASYGSLCVSGFYWLCLVHSNTLVCCRFVVHSGSLNCSSLLVHLVVEVYLRHDGSLLFAGLLKVCGSLFFGGLLDTVGSLPFVGFFLVCLVHLPWLVFSSLSVHCFTMGFFRQMVHLYY